RKRRVKCDEERPSCMRCIKTKFTCGGYVEPQQDKKNSLGRRSPKPKTPLPTQATAISPRSMAPSSIFLGETETENRYFRYFQQMATIGLDGTCGWYLWNRLIPRHIHQEPFVRHAIIAVGALSKAHDVAYYVCSGHTPACG
ncbi:hypothetical protein BDZ45DRAFT_600033, partial [Acephala macrosclerotiorum]